MANTWKAFRKREKEPFTGSASIADKPAEAAYLAAPGGTDHYANFIDAIRSGNNETLNADIIEGFYSSSLAYSCQYFISPWTGIEVHG